MSSELREIKKYLSVFFDQKHAKLITAGHQHTPLCFGQADFIWP